MKRKWWVILAVAMSVAAAGWFLLRQPGRVQYELEFPFARPIGFAPDGRLAVLSQTELLKIDSDGRFEKTSGSVSLRQASYSQVSDPDGFTVTAGKDGVIRRFDWQGEPLWSFTAPAAVSQLAVSPEGSIYVAVQDKGLLALNMDGSPRWTNNRVIPEAWPVIHGPAAGTDGRVALASGTDGLIVRDREGRMLWRNADPLNRHESPGLVFAPNLDLVVTQGLEVRRFNAVGEPQWSMNLRELVVIGGMPMINGLPIFAPDGTLYCLADERVFAIGPGGERRWEHRVNNTPSTNRWVLFLGQRWGTVTPKGDLLFLAGDRKLLQTPAGPGPALSTQMLARNERIVCLGPDGTVKWEQPVPSSMIWRVPKSRREFEDLWATHFGRHSVKQVHGFVPGTDGSFVFFGWANGKTRIWAIREE